MSIQKLLKSLTGKGQSLNLIGCFIAILFLSFSCRPAVQFSEAIPPETEALKEIPEQYRGVFICESDSSRLYANKYELVQESYYYFITTLNDIRQNTNCSLKAGGLYLPGRKLCIPIESIRGDTITAKIYEVDTLFSFSNNDVAKLYKGRLFLNVLSQDRHWVTFMISPNVDGSMNWDLIDIPDKIKKIEEITPDYKQELTHDSIDLFIINPTLIEFEKILNKNYFRECDYLIPVNINKNHRY